MKAKCQKMFVIIWPYIKTALKAVKSALQLAYILNRSSIHSPWLYFSGVILKHLTPEDLEAFNAVPLHLQTGYQISRGTLNEHIHLRFFNRIWRFILGLPGIVSRLFAYGLFFVQFLDYMYNTDLAKLTKTGLDGAIPSPPHKMIISESEILSLDTNKCPICLKKRVNDTALFVSGYVFCYTCINQYVNTYNKWVFFILNYQLFEKNFRCPVTGCPANVQHLIRLFV